MKRVIILTLFVIFVACTTLFSQTTRKIGLSGSLQSNQLGISLPIWLDKDFVLAPSVGFQYAEKVGSDLSVGLSPRFYLKNEQIAPYVGIKVGASFNMPDSDNAISQTTTVDVLGGVAFGAEYFISDHFSLGVEAQGNGTKSDKNSNRYGNPGGLNFNTATMVSATVYF